MKMNKTCSTILNIGGGILTYAISIVVLPIYIVGIIIFLIYKAIRTILGKDKKSLVHTRLIISTARKKKYTRTMSGSRK